jgi:hypothetical protein
MSKDIPAPASFAQSSPPVWRSVVCAFCASLITAVLSRKSADEGV